MLLILKVPDFLKDVQQFTKQVFISDILLHYTREKPEEVLHCTAMYNGLYPNYSPGTVDYSSSQVVQVADFKIDQNNTDILNITDFSQG